MGNLGNTVANAVISSSIGYTGNFRFSAQLAKGLSVGDGFLKVREFSGGPMSKFVYLNSTDDQSILLTITAARSYKYLHVRLFAYDQIQSAMSALQELRVRSVPIYTALGVTRFAFGKPTERYILRDRAAKILDLGYEMGLMSSVHIIRLELSSPELLHSVGEEFNPKKV